MTGTAVALECKTAILYLTGAGVCVISRPVFDCGGGDAGLKDRTDVVGKERTVYKRRRFVVCKGCGYVVLIV